MGKKLCNNSVIPHGIYVVLKTQLLFFAIVKYEKVQHGHQTHQHVAKNMYSCRSHINMIETVALLLYTSHFGCKTQYAILPFL